MGKNKFHEPVMIEEVKSFFSQGNAHLKNQVHKIIDATLGTAGYTISFCNSGAKVLGIEADEEMLEIGKKRLEEACPASDKSVGSYILAHANFKDLLEVAEENGFNQVDGIVFDLGISNLQLTNKTRGFSFSNKEALLDMRIDRNSQGVKANDLLNCLSEKELIELFEVSLSFNKARILSKRVVEKRKVKLFETVGDFLEVVERVIYKKGKLHPATKPFMALRIATNSELDNLEAVLPDAFSLLKKEGKLVVVSFHSGEDRIVKEFFKDMENNGLAKVLTHKPLKPTKEEILKNPKSRSAKMRVLQKI